MSEYGAGLLILRPSDGRILMTRRAAGESYPGFWDMPGGGVEPGEEVLETAIREGLEELGGLPGLEIKREPVWWGPNPFFAFALFLAVMDESGEPWEPVLNLEHDAFGWFPPSRLPRPALEGAKYGIGYFFGGRTALKNKSF